MNKYLSPFWMAVTTVLCIVLTVLLLPIVSEGYGLVGGVAIVAVAIACVWAVYAIRAYIFVRHEEHKEQSEGSS